MGKPQHELVIDHEAWLATIEGAVLHRPNAHLVRPGADIERRGPQRGQEFSVGERSAREREGEPQWRSSLAGCGRAGVEVHASQIEALSDRGDEGGSAGRADRRGNVTPTQSGHGTEWARLAAEADDRLDRRRGPRPAGR